MNGGANSFLRQFLATRAEIAAKNPSALSPMSPGKSKTAKGIPSIGGLPIVRPEMSLASIIEKKPNRKEIEKYLKARCEEEDD